MTPEELAELHARAMVHAASWSSRSFAEILASQTSILVTHSSSSWGKYRRGGPQAGGQTAPLPSATPKAAQPFGFALGRVIGEEAELLTLAVAPEHQRHGIGCTLLSRFESAAIAKGAHTVFLEVSDANTAAIFLYTKSNWKEVARRPQYYLGADRSSSDALIMRKDLA